mmetsp:Transcript_15191/g.43447  ORF Transcript_15191/g.43447 Transcript_15191/m.43447 type:complete len:203 (+) Transcript_15191:107-715(+)
MTTRGRHMQPPICTGAHVQIGFSTQSQQSTEPIVAATSDLLGCTPCIGPAAPRCRSAPLDGRPYSPSRARGPRRPPRSGAWFRPSRIQRTAPALLRAHAGAGRPGAPRCARAMPGRAPAGSGTGRWPPASARPPPPPCGRGRRWATAMPPATRGGNASRRGPGTARGPRARRALRTRWPHHRRSKCPGPARQAPPASARSRA